MFTIYYWATFIYVQMTCVIYNLTHASSTKTIRLDATSIVILTICVLIDLAWYGWKHKKHHSELI